MLRRKFSLVPASSPLSFEEPHNKMSWKSTSNVLIPVLNSPYQGLWMLENKCCSTHFGVKMTLKINWKITSNYLKTVLTLKIYLKDYPKLLKIFELPITKLMNVRKKALFHSLCEDNLNLIWKMTSNYLNTFLNSP